MSVLETLRRRALPITGLVLAGSIALGGCSGEADTPPSDGSTTVAEPNTDKADPNSPFLKVMHTYTADGKRITTYDVNTDESRSWPEEVRTVVAYCDGPDLVENATNYGGSSTTSAISRSVGHAACERDADGTRRLTPSDFK